MNSASSQWNFISTPLSANPTKCSNTLKHLIGCCRDLLRKLPNYFDKKNDYLTLTWISNYTFSYHYKKKNWQQSKSLLCLLFSMKIVSRLICCFHYYFWAYFCLLSWYMTFSGKISPCCNNVMTAPQLWVFIFFLGKFCESFNFQRCKNAQIM